jgi:hypothetical protein
VTVDQQIEQQQEPAAPPSPITADDRAAVCADYFGPDANLLVDVRRWRETGEVGDADELQRLERLALSRALMRRGEAYGAQVAEVLMPAETAAPDSTLTALVSKWRDEPGSVVVASALRKCANELEAALRQQASAPGQHNMTEDEWRESMRILSARPSAPAPSGAVEVPTLEALALRLKLAWETEGVSGIDAPPGIEAGYVSGAIAMRSIMIDLAKRPAPSAPSAQAWTRDLAKAVFMAAPDAVEADLDNEMIHGLYRAGLKVFGTVCPVLPRATDK